MLFDALAGVSEEYRDYQLIQRGQLPFRAPATEEEIRTQAAIAGSFGKGSKTVYIIGGIIAALGIVCLIGKQLGGIVLILSGLMTIGIGVLIDVLAKIKKEQSKLIATGVCIKKEKHHTGSAGSHTNSTNYFVVFAVDGLDKCICIAHPRAAGDYNDIVVGDRVLVVNDMATLPARKLM